MNRRGVFVVFIFAFVLAAAAWTQAQAPTLKIDFRFVAAGKALNAGNYSVAVAPNGNVVLTPESGGTAIEVPTTKTVNKTVQKDQLVFDLIGSMYFLTEAYVPGKGICILASADGSQDRKNVTAAKAK
jgi:hypothetical protein